MSVQPVLINGQWQPSSGSSTFQATNPTTCKPLAPTFPVSPREELEHVLAAADSAAKTVRGWPGSRFAAFLNAFADGIEKQAAQLVETAHEETALPVSPRLKDVELPRTTNQLRQAADAAADGSWSLPTIDSKTNIRSMFGSIGPVVVFGPNNFPFAFNSIAGGDFAAAIAAGNPVIAKGHSAHPDTTRIFAETAQEAAQATGMPAGFVQLLYRTSHPDGEWLVGHPHVGATGYTGARHTGLKLKAAADAAGKPIYLELSSINPVFILPGALAQKGNALAEEFTGSCLMGTGQFCTNPGLVVVQKDASAETFIDAITQNFENAAVGTFLGEGVQQSFLKGVDSLQQAGAILKTGGKAGGGNGYSVKNTLLTVDGATFVANSEALQTEVFGNGSLIVVADNVEEMLAIAETLEGNLTGCIYSTESGVDDNLYDQIVPTLRSRVGRLLNDKMPTGVAVSTAMNHGGPYPATGHAGFTAVGIPASLRRFAMLQCYDNVRPHRLPELLQDANPECRAWRMVDGEWTKDDVG